MKIQLLKNKRGLIYGADVLRIECEQSGKLKIGTTEINVSCGETVMPLLFNGCTGEYRATFTDSNGVSYELRKVSVRGGRIVPPPANVVEMTELRARADWQETEIEALREEIRELRDIFDTNSLNFLIN